MALTTDQLRELSRLYDRWQSGDDAAREAVQREVSASGADVARAFDLMFAGTDSEAGATLLPPIPKAMRDAAVFAVGESDADAVNSGREARSSHTSAHFSASLSAAIPTREPGQHIGPYRLIKELGRGGMGVVWLAERADGQHSRQVALKMPLVENLNWLLAARFARERNILASLEHPGIARLYDAGVDEATQPYIAIEYVAGAPITVYVREQKLKAEAVVRLFTRVIEAVAHAHTQLVIHRDIKPSNILVDAKGEPHLLDFGIAKLLDDDDRSSVDATQLTHLSGRALTLDYASPEQVNNAPIGVASDVYALGVVLYELLTGSRPYHPKGPTRRDLELAILEQEPGKPSDHLLITGTGDSEAGKSARRMRGDLDTIVLKALRKDAKLRYASAQAFADDLKRYLACQPIQARPDAALYRITKFVRRQRVPLAIALVGCTAIAGLSWRTWQQQQVAQASVARAESIDGLMRNIFRGMSPDVATAQSFSARQLLAQVQAFVAGDSMLDEVTRRSANLRVAALYREIGAFPEAIKIYEIERSAASAKHEIAAEAMALWNLANLTTKSGEHENAAPLIARLRDHMTRARSAGKALPREMDARLALVEADLSLVKGEATTALAHYRRAEQGLSATDADAVGLLAWALQGQGAAATELGNAVEARERLLRAQSLYGSVAVAQRVDQLQTEYLLAELDISTGNFASALTRLEAVIPDLEARLGRQDDAVLSALQLVATAQMQSGQFKEAHATLVRLSDANKGSNDPGRALSRANVERFVALRKAQLHLYEGDLREAALALQQLVDTSTEGEPATDRIRRIHGTALLSLGRNPDALVALSEIVRRQVADGGEGDGEAAITRVFLACAQARTGDLDAARNSVKLALPVLLSKRGVVHPVTQLAQAYAAIFEEEAPGNARSRVVLADQLERTRGWQSGAQQLASWLRTTASQRDWASLPVIF